MEFTIIGLSSVEIREYVKSTLKIEYWLSNMWEILIFRYPLG